MKSGELRDTILGKLKLSLTEATSDGAIYLKWKSQPFAVQRPEGGNLGLLTDSTATFSTGQTIGILYFKRGTGNFATAYQESNLNLFVKEGENPNTELGLNSHGDVVMKARSGIGSNVLLLISKSELRALFPSDDSVH